MKNSVQQWINDHKRIKRISFIFVLLIVTNIFFCSAQEKIPAVNLKNLNETTINTSELNNNGKPFIISFFALWCKQCMKELNTIHSIYNDWQNETGVKIIAVSTDDSENSVKVKAEISKLGWEYDILLDPHEEFKKAMGINLIPAVFVVDGKGKIVYSRTGYEDGSEKQLIKEVRKLLAEEKE